MPKLKCDVDKCLYNATGLCSRHAISIDGPHSFSKKETECCSFSPRDHRNFLAEISDINDDISLETKIHCDAKNCVFQRNAMCYADKVEIKEQKDTIGAKAQHESMCKTFECVDNCK